MRVAYVCADAGVPVFGCKGSSVHVQEVLRGLQRAGAELSLFATHFGGHAPSDLARVALHQLPELPKGDATARARAALDGNRALRAALGRAGRFDLVYERYSLWSDAGMAHAKATGCPGLLEVNAPLIDEQARHRELPLPDAAARIASSVFGDASALIAVSPGVAAYLEGFAQAHGRIHVVGNGVDAARFAPAAARRAARAGAAPVVGFVGTLKAWHGLPTLIAAFERLRQVVDARLLLVGDGPERERIAADLASRGLSAASELTGAVAHERVPALLGAMDIAVAPYPAIDGFYFSPLKIVEYMAAGLPVVASRVGHLPQLIRDGIDGLLVPPDDASALADALARLGRDPALRTALGSAARERVTREHSWDAVVARVLRIAALPACAEAAA